MPGSSYRQSNRDMLIEVNNDLNAGAGDLVEVSVPEGTVLKLSVLIYLVPVIALLIGAFTGGLIAKPLEMNSPLTSIIMGGLLMGIVYYGLKRFEKAKRSGDNQYYPRMTRIIVSADSPTLPSDSI